jgi:hypothetical protein
MNFSPQNALYIEWFKKKIFIFYVIVSIPKISLTITNIEHFFSQWPIRSPPKTWTFPPKQPYKRLNFARWHPNISGFSALIFLYFNLLAAKILRIFETFSHPCFKNARISWDYITTVCRPTSRSCPCTSFLLEWHVTTPDQQQPIVGLTGVLMHLLC